MARRPPLAAAAQHCRLCPAATACVPGGGAAGPLPSQLPGAQCGPCYCMLTRPLLACSRCLTQVAKKNPRKFPKKLEFRKYDPRVRQHVMFTETKLK